MFGKKLESKRLGQIDSLIGVGTQIEGNIRFTGGLRVDGEVKGNIDAAEGASSATLVLSELARIEGSVKRCAFDLEWNDRRFCCSQRGARNAIQGKGCWRC